MNSYQAKNGFKTFVITLSLALVVFSALYYVISDSASTVNIEDDLESSNQLAQNTSVFEDLNKNVQAQPAPAVLAGADSMEDDTMETTESTTPVPDGGTTEVTYALMLTTVLFSFAAYNFAKGPRRLALESFEERVTRNLD